MRKILLSLLSVFISLSIMAGNVTEQEALSIAQKFMQGKTLKQKSLRRAHAIGDNQFYVFNAEGQGGFVIVSADDRTVPILGYADQGSLETDHLPANARFWLESYAAQIKTLANDVQTSSTPRRALGAPVAPLLTCQWDQVEPYNHMCTFYAGYCVTGCVATAMAQVMYYHKWPQAPTTTIPAYMTQHNLSVPELSPTVFKWDKMKDTYTSNETGEAADAVAELMRYCGQAVEMDYRPDESAASVYATVMTHYFGYSQTARNVTRSTYTSLEWERLIYQEMASKRPVLYSGQSTDVGHQFVIDGYDERGLFHVNWGWGGQSDGYFTLSILNPDSRGTGGGASSNGFTMDQDAIIGLQPDQGQQAVTTLYCQGPETDERTFTRSSSANDFQIGISGRIFSAGLWNVSFDHQWVLFKDGERVKSLETKRDLNIQSNRRYNYYDGITVSSSLSFGAYIDGLRVSGVAPMLYLDFGRSAGEWIPNEYGTNGNYAAIAFLRELSKVFHQKKDGAVLIAEESTAWPMVTGDTEKGLGFDLKWNMGWLYDFLSYMRIDSYFRKGSHDKLLMSMVYAYSEKFLLPFSHDAVEVGKGSLLMKMPGEMDQKYANVRAAIGFMMAHPGKKLLFMGQDFAQTGEWAYDRPVAWDELKESPHQKMNLYVKAWNEFYKKHPALYREDYLEQGFEWISTLDADHSIIIFMRKSEEDKEKLLVILNFTPVVYENFKVGVSYEGSYKEIFNSDKKEFGGMGITNGRKLVSKPMPWYGKENSITVNVPPLGISVFECTEGR